MSEHIEDAIVGKIYDHRLMRRLAKYGLPYWRRALGALLLLFAKSGFALVGPFLTKIVVDEHLVPHKLDGLGLIALAFAATLLMGFVIEFGQVWLTQKLGQQVMVDMRKQIFSHLQELHLGFFDRNPVGRLVTRVTSDVNAINDLFTSGIVAMMGDLFMLLGIVGVLIYTNVHLALYTFSVMPLIFAGTYIFNRKSRELYRETRRLLAAMNTTLSESITGMRVIQLFNHEALSFAGFRAQNSDYYDAQRRTVTLYAMYFPGVEIATSLAIGMIIWAGGGEITRHTLTLGELVAFLAYAQMFFRPISDLSDKFNVLQGSMAAAERVFQLLDTKPDIADPATPVELPAHFSSIEFDDVHFRYLPDEPVLRGVSFSVQRGQRIAFVGTTGGGKTSMIHLLNRFYDVESGAIRVGGIDVRNVSQHALRSRMALVAQDGFLFSGTILENIRLGREDISREQCERAARMVRAWEFIERLPHGMDTVIGERGAILSVGQKQLLSFARALAFDPEVLILDEATAHVDTETEQTIQLAIETLMSGRTSLVVAHRLSTIQRADQILVVHKGHIVEHGTHQELLGQRGYYYRLYQLQFAKDESRVATEESSAVETGGEETSSDESPSEGMPSTSM